MEKNNKIDEKHIKRCIELSKIALGSGDQPFGSLIAKGEKVLTEARNRIKENDVTQHAEIIAMKKAQALLKTDDFSEYAIYSSCEPCPMCSFMIRELKFKKVVFAIDSPYTGGFSRWDILQDRGILKFKPIFSEPPEVIGGILKNEAEEVFKKIGWTMDKGIINN
jgi:tRNA(adenine34) deaminase